MKLFFSMGYFGVNPEIEYLNALVRNNLNPLKSYKMNLFGYIKNSLLNYHHCNSSKNVDYLYSVVYMKFFDINGIKLLILFSRVAR